MHLRGREIIYPTEASSGGLRAAREVFVPDTGLQFGRFLDIVSNPTSGPITARLEFDGNYGTDSETVVVATSSGDAVVGVGDAWAVVDESSFEQSKVASLWDSTLEADKADAFPEGPAPGNDDAAVVYDNVTIAPGETTFYMHDEHLVRWRSSIAGRRYGPFIALGHRGLALRTRDAPRSARLHAFYASARGSP